MKALFQQLQVPLLYVAVAFLIYLFCDQCSQKRDALKVAEAAAVKIESLTTQRDKAKAYADSARITYAFVRPYIDMQVKQIPADSLLSVFRGQLRHLGSRPK